MTHITMIWDERLIINTKISFIKIVILIGVIIMNQAMETVEGWYSLHDFRVIDWTKWKAAPEAVREQALFEFKNLLATWNEIFGSFYIGNLLKENRIHSFFQV